MKMDRIENKLLKLLSSQWQEFLLTLQRLRPTASATPNSEYQLFKINPVADPRLVQIELNPVFFELPERANARSENMIVVVRGTIDFVRENISAGQLQTAGFSTEAAYFRLKSESLEHVYGAHYDYSAAENGHPVFHAQMKNFKSFNDYLSDIYKELPVDDQVPGLLRNVRLPCAQMDFFSFFIQIFADHLIWRDSDNEAVRAFKKLTQTNCEVIGISINSANILKVPCLRSARWY